MLDRRFGRGWLANTLSNGWLLALLTSGGCATTMTHPASASSAMMGKSMLLTMPNNVGDLVTLKAGRRLVLAFWSPACAPCKKDIPEIVQREAEFAAKGAELVLVAVLADNESTESAEATLKSWGVERKFLVARESSAAREAGLVDGLPATYVLDKLGNLEWSAPKTATPRDVVAVVQ